MTAGPNHHTVLGHSLDVAACAFVLVDKHPALRAQLSRSSGIAEEVVALSFASVCAIHDIGKLDTRFQRKAAVVSDVIRPESSDTPTGPYDHGTEGFRQIEDDDAFSGALKERLGPGAVQLLRAVCGHHGILPSTDDPDPSRSAICPSLRREDARARRLFVHLILDFFAARGAALPWPDAVDGSLVQRLGGLCAIADWVGSNVEHFPYETVPRNLTVYWQDACNRAQIACGQSGLLRSSATARGFGDLFPGYKPRDVQVITESVKVHEAALIIVEAEMGKGKTEAALSLAARFLGDGVADGITIALPTMATSNAMFTRVETLMTHLFHGAEVQLGLAHGRARRQPPFQKLIEHRLHARDLDAAEASVMCARWLLNRKRILLAQVGVGTIDQALQAALVVRHQFVRMFGLSRNVVIIDEVHAYDAYMEVLLEHLLAWLGALRVPVILLSATLPSERRAALAGAWSGDAPDTSAVADDLEVAAHRPYPLVSITTRPSASAVATTTDTHFLPADQRPSSRTLMLERVSRGADDNVHVEQVAQCLVAVAKAGARVVWIRNTVREAQRAYRAVAAIASNEEHSLFHARFRGCDRSKIEQAVLERFGKAAPPGGRVLIATQVVEQSLDLDFDELHTDLAPIDLLFQRAGRLHRHDRPRPSGFEQARLFVHVPTDEDASALRFGPAHYVYDVATLWIANRALRTRSSLALPGDIRSLVEETYHPESRAALVPLGGPRLVAAEKKRADALTGKRTKARQCCIPPTTAAPGGEHALDDDDDAVQAFTRDGMSVTVLPFWWDGTHARSLDADETDVAWDINADAQDAWRLAGDLIDQTLSLPARGDAEGAPLEASDSWHAWKTRFARFAEESGLGRRVVPLPLKRDGATHKGWLRMGGRRRRVLYTKSQGLLMPSEKDEEQQR
jgi:CRISPR-associated endonuclease/helicase Cas3